MCRLNTQTLNASQNFLALNQLRQDFCLFFKIFAIRKLNLKPICTFPRFSATIGCCCYCCCCFFWFASSSLRKFAIIAAHRDAKISCITFNFQLIFYVVFVETCYNTMTILSYIFTIFKLDIKIAKICYLRSTWENEFYFIFIWFVYEGRWQPLCNRINEISVYVQYTIFIY